MRNIRIAIDCDDAAIELKNIVFDHLQVRECAVTDLAYAADKEAMYPEIGYNLAKKIQSGEYDRGILICGTGIGMSIIANNVRGVYAGLCHDAYSAERLRKSNDAQVLTMGSRVIGAELAKTILDAWIASEFLGGGSQPKVDQIVELESQSFG